MKKLKKQQKDSYGQGKEVLTNIQNQIESGNYTNHKLENIDWRFNI